MTQQKGNEKLHHYMSVEILTNISRMVGLNSNLTELNRAQLCLIAKVPKIEHE